jgi:arylsulfatase A-like enzyme
MAALGLMPVAASATSPQPAADADGTQARRPNIIFIMCDDMGYGDLGCYGQQRIETPNLDRMAQEGMRFTQAYAGSPVSAPSRATFMTGQHAGHTHVRGNREYWRSSLKQNAFGGNADYTLIGQEPYLNSHKIIPEVMKEAGYTTGMFGKWAGGYYNMQYPNVYKVDANGNTDTSKSGQSSSASLPNKRGVDCYYGYICQFQAHTYYPNFLNRYDPEKYGDKHVVVDTLKQNIQHKDVASGNKDYENREQYTSDLIHQYALDWIDRQDGEQPFMGIFTYTLPHAELWQPNDSLLQKYTEKFKGEDSNYGGNFGSWYYRNYGRRAQFAAMVSRLDAQVGEIFDKLEEKGLADNTLVIFTSDNGPHEEGGADPAWFNHDGLLRGTKRSTHEGGIRVPFIAKGPGVPAGTVNDHQLAFYDVMPTLLDYAGLDGSQYSLEASTEECRYDGISFNNTLTGNDEEQKKHEFLYWEFHETDMMALRMGDWKLVVNAGTPKLYDLSTDIHEDKDLAEQRPDIVAAMVEIMHQQHTESSMFRVTMPERRRTGEFITMTFDRPQTGAPVVSCLNERLQTPEGVKVTVEDMHPAQQTKGWTGNAVRAGRDLTPGTNVADTVRYVTFRIDGMPADYAVGKISAEIAGTTAMGGYWSRMYDFDFTFSVQTSKNGSDWTDFGMQRGNIVPVLNESAEWEFSGENAVFPTDPFFVKVNMVNNSPKYKSYSSLFSLILQRDPDAETSISEVGEDFVQPVSGTYDLSGRPVGTTAKGVLIEDGKVVLK